MLDNSSPIKQGQTGFTLVELLVSISVMAIVAVVFIGMASSYLVLMTRNNELSEITISSQNLLRSTVTNLRFGDGVRQSNQTSDPNAPSGGWNTNNSAFVIIIAIPALSAAHDYIIDPDTGSPYMNELVYYKNGSKLMERKLANPNATGNSLKTTCPSNLATNSCLADIQLATYVNTMNFTLYDQNAVQTSTPSLARSVNITLNMKRNAPGNQLNLTTNMRVTLRNRF